MLVAVWIITFCLIIGIGIYAGTKIKSANQWSGGDKTMGALSLGCVFAAWQIGGMAVVGAAQNGYNLGISGAWYSIAGSFYFIALAVFAKIIRERMPGESVPVYLQTKYDVRTTRLYSYAWIVYGFLYIPIQLKTVSSIIQIVLPGLNLMVAMFIGVTIASYLYKLFRYERCICCRSCCMYWYLCSLDLFCIYNTSEIWRIQWSFRRAS